MGTGQSHIARRAGGRETRRLLAGALERIPAIELPEPPQAPETAPEEPGPVDIPYTRL